jgi:tRNA A-37 threonylcarbamoyl transferase component Bud32
MEMSDVPAVTADRFLDALRQSGLLAPELFEAQVRRSAAEGPPEHARELADRFVRDGLLTPYQAEQLLHGRWQSLVIAGKYVVHAPLGAGGMGQVFLCEHVVMRRRVAVKVLPARLTADAAAVERFRREARAIAALDHPNIVRAHDVDIAEEVHFLVMEYVDGVSLQDLVARSGPVEVSAAADYIAQAARGLQHAHQAGWVHRDVKPANLLLDRGGTVKVLDLGLARLLCESAEPLTGATDPLGTADYLAPEQATDSHSADIRADVYSLGATLYFLLTGSPPFPDGTPAQKVLWHQTRPPRLVRESRPEVPAGLAAVLDRMLAKDPANRYQTPVEVADVLQPWIGDMTHPPPVDAVASGVRSGAMSSWARDAGSSGVLRTPMSGRKRPLTAETVGGLSASVATAVPAAPLSRPRRPRRPILLTVGALGVIAIVVTGVAMLRPWNEPVGKVREFVGHTGAIEKVAFTPDGRRLVTVSQDNTARVWDVKNGAELKVLKGHTKAVRGLTVLPDGRRAATAGWDGTVRLWDLDSGEQLRQYVGHSDEVWSVTCNADGSRLLTGGKDHTVRLWDVETGAELKRLGGFFGHGRTVTAVQFLPDGRRAVSASEDRSLRLWDLETGEQKRRFNVPKMVYRISLCCNKRWVLFGCGTDLVRWDPDGQNHHNPVASPEPVEGVTCLPDKRLALAMLDGTIRLWEIDPDREVSKFEGNGNAVLSIAAAPDGKHIVSGGRDKIARLWNLPQSH